MQVRFVVVFSLLLLGFSQAFNILFINQDELEIGYGYPFRTLTIAMYNIFLMAMGELGSDNVWGEGEHGPMHGTSHMILTTPPPRAIAFIISLNEAWHCLVL